MKASLARRSVVDVFFRFVTGRPRDNEWRARWNAGGWRRKELSRIALLQLLLDLNKQRDRLGARRSLESHPLVAALHIYDFPTVVIFKRNVRLPVYTSE